MRIVCISDTHLRHVAVPDGDVLVHAGDFTMQGHLREVESFNKWLAQWPHLHKIVVAGNHDVAFQERAAEARAVLTAATYLQDEFAEIAGLRMWVSPWTPTWGEWAFMRDRGPSIREKWQLIPEGLDLLITHGPPAYICDRTLGGEHVGCEDLREIVEARRPRLHVFGQFTKATAWSRSQGRSTSMLRSATGAMRRATSPSSSTFELSHRRGSGG